jgi:hypothetical protein
VRVLSGLHGYRRRVLVMGDMLELGELSAELHHDLGREAARAGVDAIVLVGTYVRPPRRARSRAGSARSARPLRDHRGGRARRGELVREGDVVLVKGSRGMALERVVGARCASASDRGQSLGLRALHPAARAGGLRVFGYISFRMAMAALTAFALALWWGKHVIAGWRKRDPRGRSKAPHEELVKLGADRPARARRRRWAAASSSRRCSRRCSCGRASTTCRSCSRCCSIAGCARSASSTTSRSWTIPGCKGLSSRAKMAGLSAVTLAALLVLCWYARATGRASLLDLYAPFSRARAPARRLGRCSAWGSSCCSSGS